MVSTVISTIVINMEEEEVLSSNKEVSKRVVVLLGWHRLHPAVVVNGHNNRKPMVS